jgi:hypothetical protein
MTKKKERKFYKYRLSVEILSEERMVFDCMNDVAEAIHDSVDGDLSGRWLQCKETVMNGKQAARALRKQNSDASFFNLTDKGEKIDG